ncbi:MAG TPA: type V CRISPR-associated protein Cas12b, partial [Bryobacteraceae bacterium]|nr:type V CRISPR-associated protein Cas12b [Bryobacteraceae bacterium]
MNRGTKAFGDWLLTLRGGLCHTLADAEIPTKDKNTSRSPTDAERRDRRILLALSWLNVEDEQGAPAQCGVRVAIGRDAPKQRGEAVEAALRGILKKRGLSDHEIQPWLRDCGPSLRARIREDAAWINRSACFDNAVASMGPALTREEVWDFLEPFFDTREAYFGGLTNSQKEGDEPTMQDEKSKDLVQKASQWLSSRFGTAKGADFQSITIAYQRIAKWAAAADSGRAGTTTLDDLAAFLKVAPGSDSLKCVLHRISGPGYKSATRNSLKKIATQSSVMQEDLRTLSERAEQDASACEKKTGRKGPRPWADAILKDVQDQCRFTYLPQEG